MERTKHRPAHEPINLHDTPAAQLLDRIQQNTRVLTERSIDLPAGPEPFRMMRRVAEDLERVAVPLILAVEHCNQMLHEPVIEGDVAMLRDTTHLCARIEAMVSQLEDTVRTLERLMERPAHEADVLEVAAGDGSVERVEQVDRPSLRRPTRGLPPAIEV